MTAPRRQNGRDAAKLARSCTEKHRWADEFAARAVAQNMCIQGVAKKGAMWVYPCEACRGWHVTSKHYKSKFKVTAEHLFIPDPFDELAEKQS